MCFGIWICGKLCHWNGDDEGWTLCKSRIYIQKHRIRSELNISDEFDEREWECIARTPFFRSERTFFCIENLGETAQHPNRWWVRCYLAGLCAAAKNAWKFFAGITLNEKFRTHNVFPRAKVSFLCSFRSFARKSDTSFKLNFHRWKKAAKHNDRTNEINKKVRALFLRFHFLCVNKSLHCFHFAIVRLDNLYGLVVVALVVVVGLLSFLFVPCQPAPSENCRTTFPHTVMNAAGFGAVNVWKRLF